MNKKQIKAELRRSACEDEYPAIDIGLEIFGYLYFNWRDGAGVRYKSSVHCRTFYLLVAEAL